MGDMTLVCAGCCRRFVWTEKEQLESAQAASAEGDVLEPEPYCAACRPKQDQQRA